MGVTTFLQSSIAGGGAYGAIFSGLGFKTKDSS